MTLAEPLRAVNLVAAGIPAFVSEVVSPPEPVAVLDELLPGAPVVGLTSPEEAAPAGSASNLRRSGRVRSAVGGE